MQQKDKWQIDSVEQFPLYTLWGGWGSGDGVIVWVEIVSVVWSLALNKRCHRLNVNFSCLGFLYSFPGAWVTATDLPEILSNLTFNLVRNTKGRSRYTPQVTALTWGRDLERDFPYPSYHYDYVLAADVVYHHDYLEELLDTMHHFCRPGSQTTVLWANKIRFQSDLRFTESFKSSFNTTLLAELPQQDVRIYKATAKEWQKGQFSEKL